MDWRPTEIRRFVRAIPSSAHTAVVETDAGTAYLKAMGGQEGPHTLASELVATRLARWFDLPTLDFTVIELPAVPEIPFLRPDGSEKGFATPGPAFITRSEEGQTWSGERRQLRKLANPDDVGRLVVFDTWTLNCDRYSHSRKGGVRENRDNVWLSEEGPDGQDLLKAMDHTHCFTCGGAFGLFPAFREHLGRSRRSVRAAAAKLRTVSREIVEGMVADLPSEWDVSGPAREALVSLIVTRAAYVAETIEEKIWPQKSLLPGASDPEMPQ
jgi:hypothetical protein